MSWVEQNEIIRYSYNWYRETGLIPLLFDVRYATEAVMGEIVDKLIPPDTGASNYKVVAIPCGFDGGVTMKFLLEVLFPAPVRMLPFKVFDSLRKKELRNLSALLNRYNERYGTSAVFTLDRADFKLFVAYELTSMYSLPCLMLLEDGDILKVGRELFHSRYAKWEIEVAETLVNTISAEEAIEVLGETPAYKREIHKAYSNIDGSMGDAYVVSNFATHIIEAKLLEEINAFLERIEGLD